MRDLNFLDINGTVNVTYRTDLIGTNSGNFTIMEIKGLTALDRLAIGMNFQKLSYNAPSFIAFAKTHALKLTSSDAKGSTVLVDATPLTSSLGFSPTLGQDNL